MPTSNDQLHHLKRTLAHFTFPHSVHPATAINYFLDLLSQRHNITFYTAADQVSDFIIALQNSTGYSALVAAIHASQCDYDLEQLEDMTNQHYESVVSQSQTKTRRQPTVAAA